MKDSVLKLMDPEILEGMKQLAPELTEGGPIDQSYLAMREMVKAWSGKETYFSTGLNS